MQNCKEAVSIESLTRCVVVWKGAAEFSSVRVFGKLLNGWSYMGLQKEKLNRLMAKTNREM